MLTYPVYLPSQPSDEPLDDVSGWDTYNSRVIINAEEVVDDLRVLLRTPVMEVSDRRRTEGANNNNNHNNNNNNNIIINNNNNNDNDNNNIINNNNNNNNNDDDNGVTFDVRWVPSLFSLSNTDRVALFSGADVLLAPHGAHPYHINHPD